MTGGPEVDKQADALPETLRGIPVPPALCRWSIHCDPEAAEAQVDDIDFEPDLNPDPLDEASWKPWPQSWKNCSLQERLLEGLASNRFSNVITDDLPIAIPQVIIASERSDDRFLEEAFGFSIMARNEELVGNLGRQLQRAGRGKLSGLYPLHLAASFLDGSKGCCTILTNVLASLGPGNIEVVNTSGHTILDTLMMTILKSHTSVSPGVADDSLRDERRFPGEEVDICGRWDADSDCFRSLVAAGQVSIPFDWKHKLCHTSAQAITHCIIILGEFHSPQILFAHSGLFLRRCPTCGMKMELQPLHVLVVIAFYVAEAGCEREDLFGVLAILLAMLYCGASPTTMASVSLSQLFDCKELSTMNVADIRGCDHQVLNLVQLADAITCRFVNRWSQPCITGWNIIRYILRTATAEWARMKMPMDVDDCEVKVCKSYFGNSQSLLSTFAAVQIELLTYRRESQGDPWVSKFFDMQSVEKGLANGANVFLEGFGGHEMKFASSFCSCDFGSDIPGIPRACEATDGDFSNLERN